MKPMIGVTPLWDAVRQSVWMLPDYLEGIKAAGGLPVVLPLEMSESDANQMGSCLPAVRMSRQSFME